MSHRPDHQVDNLVKRINRIEGQIGGIKKMIVDEKPFDEVIIQLNSAKAAIQKISQILLEAHADHTFMDAVKAGRPNRNWKVYGGRFINTARCCK